MRLRRQPISPRTRRRALQLAPLVVVATLVGIAASELGGRADRKSRARDRLSGAIAIDGSAALLQMSQSAARRFEERHPGVRVTVGASGDESSIDSFCAGEVDIAEVARRLKPAERRQCKSAGVRLAPIEFAREGIVMVVSDRNGFARCLTLDQVRSIWRPDSPVRSWADVDPAFPAVELQPVGWKPDSPPYTLLAEGLFGSASPMTRDDYEIAGDASGLALNVNGSAGKIGYLPRGELRRAAGVRTLSLDGGGGCVRPTAASVRDGGYPVLSRPLDLNVNAASMRRPEVRSFVRAYLRAGRRIRAAAGVVGVPRSHRVHVKFTRP
jgi:phosphate transport system substrate-binding protein